MNPFHGLREEPWCPEPLEPIVFAHCACCGGEIYRGEDAYDLPNVGLVCQSCIDEAKVSEVGWL